jgi:hypothetical protein
LKFAQPQLEPVRDYLSTHIVDVTYQTNTIDYYQQLGCWNPPVTISRETYEVALDVFLHAKLITQRHPYEQVVVLPPEG